MSTVPKHEMVTVNGVEMTLLSRTRDSVTGDVHVQAARYEGDVLVVENWVCGEGDVDRAGSALGVVRNRMKFGQRALRILSSL
jgi:hypothetical protein